MVHSCSQTKRDWKISENDYNNLPKSEKGDFREEEEEERAFEPQATPRVFWLVVVGVLFFLLVLLLAVLLLSLERVEDAELENEKLRLELGAEEEEEERKESKLIILP